MNITFAGDKVNLTGTPIKIGDKAPSFKATFTDLSEFDSSNLKDRVVIYSVVPSIDTKVCSLQTQRFNEEAAKLDDDIRVVTVSLDLPFAQERFCGAHGIEQAMIVSDFKNREFGKNYGFYMENIGLLARGIVVVDKDGIVQYVEYVPEVTNEVDFDKALEEAKKLV